MVYDVSQAAAIYQQNANRVENATKVVSSVSDPAQISTDREQIKSNFLETIRNYARGVVDENENAERVATDAITGEANLTEVITAVASAEASLQTLVTVRDRVISAYQEIMRMPI